MISQYFCVQSVSMENKYTVPGSTRIGHVHLKVSNIERSLQFYRDILGFEVQQWYGDQAVFLSAGGYHHHIGLNTWQSKNAPPAPVRAAGLYHTAILYPTRKDLANILKRLIAAKYPVSGAADHGVSEAIYMNDPDKNGVELYWDKPEDLWPRDEQGGLLMITESLDLGELLSLAD
jgi:catechol 2,3-dioxygenase